jgi:hypothetical protein
MIMEGIEVNPDDAYERDIVWRFTQMWAKMPRHLRTDQRWADLVLFCRLEIQQHRAKIAKRP